jgi:hypothetical protein
VRIKYIGTKKKQIADAFWTRLCYKINGGKNENIAAALLDEVLLFMCVCVFVCAYEPTLPRWVEKVPICFILICMCIHIYVYVCT